MKKSKGYLVLVRHAESEGNLLSAEDRSGLTKPNHAHPITELGKKQAEATRQYLVRHFGKFDVYYVTTFRRTRETMKIMYPSVIPVEDARLNEWWKGIWHTMSEDRIREFYPDEFAIKEREGFYHYRPFGGESGMDVEIRIHLFLLELHEQLKSKNVLMCVHGR